MYRAQPKCLKVGFYIPFISIHNDCMMFVFFCRIITCLSHLVICGILRNVAFLVLSEMAAAKKDTHYFVQIFPFYFPILSPSKLTPIFAA